MSISQEQIFQNLPLAMFKIEVDFTWWAKLISSERSWRVRESTGEQKTNYDDREDWGGRRRKEFGRKKTRAWEGRVRLEKAIDPGSPKKFQKTSSEYFFEVVSSQSWPYSWASDNLHGQTLLRKTLRRLNLPHMKWDPLVISFCTSQ